MFFWARGVCFGSVIAGLLVLHAQASAADDSARTEARKLAYAGVAAYQASDFRTASEKLERAFAMLPAPSVGLYSARALVKLGKLTEGAARYRQIAQLVITAGERNVQETARQNAAAELASLTPQIPRLRVQLEGATVDQVQVLLDGNALSASDLGSEILLDPGAHELQGRRGAQVVVSKVALHEGEQASAVLLFPAPVAPSPPTQPLLARVADEPPPPPAQPSSAMRTAGWVGLGAGSGALALSGVSLLIALGDKPGGCTSHVCDGSVSGYNTWRTVSTVGFYAGVVLGAAGVTLLLAAPKSNPSAQALSLTVQASGASFTGSF
jgi:hypothetical protein